VGDGKEADVVVDLAVDDGEDALVFIGDAAADLTGGEAGGPEGGGA
jgi:hypothetical protein